MLGFEKFRSAAAPRVESSEKSPAEERREAIDRVIQALPQLRPVILAFVTSTALMSAPEYVRADTGKTTAEDSQENGSEASPEIRFEIPPAAFYEHRMSLDSKDGDENIQVHADGTIPESAENVVIGLNRNTDSRLQTVNGGGDIRHTFTNDFYILPIEGESSSAEGGKAFEMKGVGETPQEALQNALEEAVDFMGLYVESEKSLEEKSDGDTASSDFSDHITTRSAHPIKGFRVIEQQGDSIDGVEGARGYCSVTVEIVPAGA
jgi:hypothetical protein